MKGKLKTAVMGATGYSGLELTRILARHPRVETALLLRRENDSKSPDSLADVFPTFAGNGGYSLESFSWGKLDGVALLFLVTPREFSRRLVPEGVARGFRVVD